METHKKPNHNLKHRCSICGATYARSFALRDHIKQQHMDVEQPYEYMDQIVMTASGMEMNNSRSIGEDENETVDDMISADQQDVIYDDKALLGNEVRKTFGNGF